uniref:LITAF domain-containing protein n=1 Tax=Rhabditophanes sp. KR3021 TaxID=114890 RepID=A0AC35U4G3_9BILA
MYQQQPYMPSNWVQPAAAAPTPNIIIQNSNNNAMTGGGGLNGLPSIPKRARQFVCPCCKTGTMYRKTRFWIVLIVYFLNIVIFPFGLISLLFLFSDRLYYRKCDDCKMLITAKI